MRAHHYKNQIGQTLIETLVAIFILVMGITAALGLATFSLHSSTNIVKQLIGMGLAREGLEAVKNMRDTNWLKDTLVADGCYDFRTNTPNNAPCYLNWLNAPGGYDIDPGSGSRQYLLDIDTEAETYWVFNNSSVTALGFDPVALGTEFYNPAATAPDYFGTQYFRKIIVTKESIEPYDQPNLERLKVESQVWWTDKDCPAVADFPGTGECAVNLTVFLTNWKNYQ